MIHFTLNGKDVRLDAPAEMPLLWAIRDHLDLTGTKFGCGIGACGACTVHLDGQAVRGCQTPVGDAVGHKITTIEGVAGKVADAVQAAWRDIDVVQCGYCQSGQIMSAIGLLNSNPHATDAQIEAAMDGNVCRCATYVRIREAIRLASKNLGA